MQQLPTPAPGPNQSPQYPAPAGPPSQFDFIMQNPDKPKRQILGGGNKQLRILVFAVGLGLLLGIAMLFMSVLNKASNAQMDAIEALAYQQARLINVAGQYDKAREQSVINYGATVYYGLKTSQTRTINYLANNGRKLNVLKVSQTKDAEAEATLKRSDINGTFDSVFMDTLSDQLADYNTALQGVKNGADSPGQKLYVEAQFKSLTPLAKNSGQPQAAPAPATSGS